MSTNQAHIDQLAARVLKGSQDYYHGTPSMLDSVWDSLADELRKLDPQNPALTAVGAAVPSSGAATATGGWVKTKHTIPMGSLNKAQFIPDMQSWFASCVPVGVQPSIIVSDKCDGASIGLRYENRKLVQAITRGDGTTGEDVTKNVLLMQGAIKMLPPMMPDGKGGQIPTPVNVYVRGEIVVTLTDFALFFKGDSNPRNSASGTMKRQSDPAKCSKLTILAYQLLPNGAALEDKECELKALEQMGFQMPRWCKLPNLKAVEDLYQLYIASVRKSLNYEIDGLVLDINDTAMREGLGELNGRPKGSLALKFPREEKETILRDILWQVGNSGRVTPVAIFDEVILGGRKIKQASLAGVRQVEYLKLSHGCRILASLRGDVIPRVEANLDEGIANDL